MVFYIDCMVVLIPEDSCPKPWTLYLVTSFVGVVIHYLLDKDSFNIEEDTGTFIRFLLRHARE